VKIVRRGSGKRKTAASTIKGRMKRLRIRALGDKKVAARLKAPDAAEVERSQLKVAQADGNPR